MVARLVSVIVVMFLFSVICADRALCIGPQDTLRTDTGEIIPTPDPGECGVDYADSQFIASLRPDYLTLPSGESEAWLDSCSVDSSLKALFEDHYVQYVEQVFAGAELNDTLRIIGPDTVRVPDVSQIFLLQQDAACDVLDAIEDMYGHEATRFAEPNDFGELLDEPNDEYWEDQWNFMNDGYGIGCPTAWSVTPGSTTVKVGIIDSGVNYEHPDLGGDDFPNDKVVDGYDFGDRDSDPMDVEGHGTAVAGIAGALTNNYIGVAGIAGGWHNDNSDIGIQICALKYRGQYGGAGTKAAAIWKGSYTHGCHILNCSWLSGAYDLMRTAIFFAYSLRVSIVAGKGNCQAGCESKFLPADCEYRNWVISVGSYGEDGKYCKLNDNCTSGSSYGKGIDISGPGNAILAPALGQGYVDDFCCTSAAAAHASGVVALLKSMNNTLFPEDYDGILRFSADDPAYPESDGNEWSWHEKYGHGRLKASTAVIRLHDPDWGLFSYTATGGSSLAQSDIYTCKFQEGELDGYRYVQRCSVAVKVVYPESFGDMPYVWGLGNGTVGWSGSSPNFQVGWCQLVPASQRIDGCQLFTYVYKVYESDISPRWTWYPCAPEDVQLRYRLWGQPTTGTPKMVSAESSSDFSFGSNYPDPFNSCTSLNYRLSQSALVDISVYDILGQKVAVLRHEYQVAGEYCIQWYAVDCPSGIYFARFEAGNYKKNEKLVLLK